MKRKKSKKEKKARRFSRRAFRRSSGRGREIGEGVLFFSPPPPTTEMHVARQWGDHSNVFELSCKGRGHLRSTGTFGASDDVSMPFPFKGSLFSTALSPSKEEEENLVSRRRRPINLSSFYSPSRAPGSTRPRASRPRRRMRVRLWSRRAPGFVNQGVNGRGEREKRREEGEKAILSDAPKFGNASRRRRRRKKKNVGLLLLFPPSSPLSLSPLSHLQVTEQQERVVDLHV